MAEIDDDFIATGAQIVWVLEQDASFGDGTAVSCFDTMSELGADAGWCVGDDETLPEPDVWDDSPLANNRGFEIIVDRSTMQVVWTSSHGSGSNDNVSPEELLAEVVAAVGAR